MSSIVLGNKDLMTKIFQYVGDFYLCKHFKTLLHPNFMNFIEFIKCEPRQTLIYGQVQSGKTNKIIEYIKQTIVPIKILIIQNNLSMMMQYEKKLEEKNINFITVSSDIEDYFDYFRGLYCNMCDIVLLVINNYSRIDNLNKLMNHSKVKIYSLFMDESDMYVNHFKSSTLYQNAVECIHITATPFVKMYDNYFDNFININPPINYVGLNNLNVKMIEFNLFEINEIDRVNKLVDGIITDDFLTINSGIILVNVYSSVHNMEILGKYLSKLHNHVPVVLLNSNTTLLHNGKTTRMQKTTISQVITKLDNYKHIILIASRLSSRGLNYTNDTYTRHLTHQIIYNNNNVTNFMQKCRILGIKNDYNTNKFNLYIFNGNYKFYNKVLDKLIVCNNCDKFLKNAIVIDEKKDDENCIVVNNNKNQIIIDEKEKEEDDDEILIIDDDNDEIYIVNEEDDNDEIYIINEEDDNDEIYIVNNNEDADDEIIIC